MVKYVLHNIMNFKIIVINFEYILGLIVSVVVNAVVSLIPVLKAINQDSIDALKMNRTIL